MYKEPETDLQKRLPEGGDGSIYCIVYAVRIGPNGVQNACPDVSHRLPE